MPGKKTILITTQNELFPDKPAKFGRRLTEKLNEVGVQIIFGQRAENLELHGKPYKGTLHLTNGQKVTADVIFPAIGARAISTLLVDLPNAVQTTSNRVKVDSWLRPSSYPNVFSIGDASDTGDSMTIAATTRQVPWLKKALLAIVAGKKIEDIRPYNPWIKSSPIVVPIGPNMGQSFLAGIVAGNCVTKMLKGGDIVTHYNKIFGRNFQ